MASGASIDSWSDSEIRTKLAELGTPVGPVTETTRKILIKKLKRLLQLQSNNAASPAKPRRSLARYSSDESQGEDANMPPPTTKVKNLRRKTVGPTELSVVSDSSVTEISRSGISERTTRGSRKTLGNISVPKDYLDTDSDSDLSSNSPRSRLRKSRKSEASVLDPSSTFQETRNETLKSWNSLKRTSDILPSSSRMPDPQIIHVQKEEEDEEELEDTEEEEEEQTKAPVFQSNFLTRLKSSGKLPESYRSSVSPKPEWKRTSPSYPQSFLTQRGIRSFDEKVFSTRHEINSYVPKPTNMDGYTSLLSQRQTTSHNINTSKGRINSLFTQYRKYMKLLLGCVAVVGFLFVVYFLLLTNFSTRIYLAAIDSDDNKYPVCGQDGVNQHMCVQENQLKPALDVSKIFIPKVLEVTTKAYCDPASNSDSVYPTMSEDEALKYLGQKMPTVSSANLVRDLRNFKILVLANPHWEVEIVKNGLTDPNAILFNGAFAASRVDLPIACYLRLTAYKLIKVLIFLAVLVGSGLLTLFGTRLYKKSQEKHKQEVYSMVNKVLYLLSAHHEQNILPGYLAINNCRDELIPPSERNSKKRVWDDAVEFLEKHESRVRTEVHSLRGENMKVWRWLPAGGPPLSPNTSVDSSAGPILGRLL